MTRRHLFLPLLLGCADVTEPSEKGLEEQEIITTVELTLLSEGGESVVASWSDAQNDGNPIIDELLLPQGVQYTMSVRFLNELESPAEDITTEIEDEADQHQVFYTGSGVIGPASNGAEGLVEHVYDDEDSNGLPIGLQNTLTTLVSGESEIVVTLRHMPPENGQEVKNATTAEDVLSGGFGAIGGENDVSVSFPLSVSSP